MQFKSIVTTVILALATTVSYSQIVASVNSFEDFSSYNTVAISQLTYEVVDADTNANLTRIDYSAVQEKLQINSEESIQFISLSKDGADFLTKMPVFANNLNLSMSNYQTGEYSLHLNVEGKAVPTVIQITKE